MGRGVILTVSITSVVAAASCSLFVGLDGLDSGGDASADEASIWDSQRDSITNPLDAGTTCAWDAIFTDIHPLNGLVPNQSAAAQLSPNESIVYFQAKPDGDGAAPWDLYQATRADRDASFRSLAALSELNGPANENNITVRTDGLLTVFYSDRDFVEAGTAGLFTAQRTLITDAFGAPVAITTLNVTDFPNAPFITSDGRELWFGTAVGATTDHATFVAPITVDGGFAQATPRTDIPGWEAVLSNDKLTVYYAAGKNSLDNAVLVSHRNGVLDPFPPASLVSEVNVAGETPSWLSPDQCRLYFTTRRNGGADVYVAERFP